MQSKAATVESYVKAAPAERFDALTKLRSLCLQQLKGYEEVMEYGGPCYKKNNIVEVGFASQKHFIALYILKQDVIAGYKNQLERTGISVGKGAIRFTKPGEINFELINKMLKDTYISAGPVC